VTFFVFFLCIDFEFFTPKYPRYFIDYLVVFHELNPIMRLKHGQEIDPFKPLILDLPQKKDSFKYLDKKI